MTKRRTRRTFGAVRRLPSKRYQASYVHEGQRHAAPETFGSVADADAWLADRQAEINRGAWVDPAAGKITVATLLARWLASDDTKRASSRARDESIIGKHLPAAFMAKRVAAVTPDDIQKLVNGWAKTGAPSSVGRQYSTLRAAFAYAVNSDLVARTPCRGIRLPKAQLVDRPELSAEQLDRLAAALGDDQAAMMWLGAVGGLRWAEAAGMTVGALDLLAGKVTVSRQLGRDGVLGPPKSAAGRRTLTIPRWLAVDLAAVVARRGLTAADADGLVFTTAEGKPLDYTNWRRRVWVPACDAAKLPGLRFHDLRSMAATALVAAGVDIKTAQTRLGHSSPSVTLGVYARATEAADRLAADALGAFFRPGAVSK